MSSYRWQNFGFTLLEILIVVSLIGIIVTISVIGFQNFASYQQYNQAVGDVEFILNQTKTKARSAFNDESHGVHISSDTITQFIGSTYNPVDSTNLVNTYELVTLQENLTGGVDTIVFNKLTGIPSATGTIVISGTAFVASTTITISDSGVIQ